MTQALEQLQEPGETCECGWSLPALCGAFRFGTDPDRGAKDAPGVYVAFSCPECGATHSFINEELPGAKAEKERHARRYQEENPGRTG